MPLIFLLILLALVALRYAFFVQAKEQALRAARDYRAQRQHLSDANPPTSSYVGPDPL